jgi:high affinity sulfate transporter 1
MARSLPILAWLPGYQRAWLRVDLLAGLTLAAYAVPVALAYASLAGLPAEAGLYGYMLGGVAYALFCSSRHVAIGPTSAIAITIAGGLGALAIDDPARYSTLAAVAAALVGAIGVAGWSLRLGQLASFISDSLLSGFKIGAALVIASTQLPKLFGLAAVGDDFFTRMIHLLLDLPATHLPSLAVGAGGLLLLALGERVFPSRPVALVVVLLSIALMSVTDLAAAGVKVVGEIGGGIAVIDLSQVTLPDVRAVLPIAIACFLLSYVESISVVRSFALKHGYAIDADREMLALGTANLAVGLGQGFPVGGGMSQSAVNEKGGAQTPVSLLVAAMVIAAVVLFLTGLFRNLPAPILAAVVLMAIKGLVDIDELRHLYRVSRLEFHIALVAAVGVLLFGILNGVLLAAIAAIVLIVRRAARPYTAELGRVPGTSVYSDITRNAGNERIPGALIARIEGTLLYFNVEHVQSELLERIGSRHSPVSLVVLDLSASPGIDRAGVRMVAQLRKSLEGRGIAFRLAEVRGKVRDMIRADGVADQLGIGDRGLSVAEIVAAFAEPGTTSR